MQVRVGETALDALDRPRQRCADIVGTAAEVSSHETKVGHEQPRSQARRAVRSGAAQGAGQFTDACEQLIELRLGDLWR